MPARSTLGGVSAGGQPAGGQRGRSLGEVSAEVTPTTLRAELKKLRDHKHVPTLLYHLEPTFEDAIEKECAKIRGHDLTVLRLGDQFVL